MTTHIPLNGDAVIRAAEAALTGGSVAGIIRATLEGREPDQEEQATGPVTMTTSEAPKRAAAVDPSQGRGPALRRTNNDPLLTALTRMVGARRRR